MPSISLRPWWGCRLPPWMLFAVLAAALAGVDAAVAQEAGQVEEPADPLQALILEGIQNNMRLLESFEIVVTIKEKYDMAHVTPQSKPGDAVVMKQDRTALLHIWHDGKQWRQDLETTILSGATVEEIARTGATVPHAAKMVFDGEKTKIHREHENAGYIRPGRVMERNPSKDLKYGYSVWGIHLQKDLPRAARIEFVPDDSGMDYVEVDFEVPGEGTVKMLLNPQRGFMIEKAEAINTAGQLAGERKATGFQKVRNGACLLLGIHEETYEYDGTERRSTGFVTMTAEPVSVNEPIDPDVFKVEFPPGTRVSDEITGNKYRIPGGLAADSAPATGSSRLWLILANVAALLAIVGVIVIVRNRRGRPQEQTG